MVDKNNVEIKIGDVVECIDPIEGCLVKGKTYKVQGLREEEKRIVIIPDERNLEGHYLSRRFILKN